MPQKVYRRAHALIVTSHWETGPIVIWEAMAHSVPIVSSAYVGSGLEAALVDRINCLLFPIGNTQAAAIKIGELVTSSPLMSQLRMNALQTFQQRYTIPRSVDVWHQVMQATLQRRPQGELPRMTSSEGGRLNRLLGLTMANRIRAWTGKRPPDTGPGGEWPHTLCGDLVEDAVFWEMATSLDKQQHPRHIPENAATSLTDTAFARPFCN
jgi:hypothetical protein